MLTYRLMITTCLLAFALTGATSPTSARAEAVFEELRAAGGSLPFQKLYPHAVSGDGEVVVGYGVYEVAPGDNTSTIFRWTSAGGADSLREDLKVMDAVVISDDGKVIAGHGYDLPLPLQGLGFRHEGDALTSILPPSLPGSDPWQEDWRPVVKGISADGVSSPWPRRAAFFRVLRIIVSR